MGRPLRDNEPTRWTAGEIRVLQEEGEQMRALVKVWKGTAERLAAILADHCCDDEMCPCQAEQFDGSGEDA